MRMIARPALPHRISLRTLALADAAGEALAALSIIAGGVLAYGFLPFA